MVSAVRAGANFGKLLRRDEDARAAQSIAESRLKLAEAELFETVADIERQAALTYWKAQHSLPVMYPRINLREAPDHWLTFGSCKWPITGSPRLLANPPKAMLNYLYAILESESRLALAALGLDTGLGVTHVDTNGRDCLASDLMEATRPQVDAYVLDWITREPLRQEWFFEQ